MSFVDRFRHPGGHLFKRPQPEVAPSSKFSPAETESSVPKINIIVEGGFEDTWGSIGYATGTQSIADNAKRLTYGRYTLDLIARRRGGVLEEIPLDDRIGGPTSELDEGFIFHRVGRPATVLTQDGRLFSDTSLAGDDARLYRFLAMLKRDYGEQDPFSILFSSSNS